MAESGTEKTKRLVKRLEGMKKRRRQYEPVWEEIVKYLSPYRSLYAEPKSEGKEVGTSIFDGSPIVFLNTLADGFLGYMTSRSMRWLALRMAKRELEEIPGVREWLQEAEEGVYSAFQRSNFYESMHEYFSDGGSIGTATLYIEEDIENEKINFTTCHPWEIYIDENEKGKVDTVFRVFELTYRQIARRFKDGLNEDLKRQADKMPDERTQLLHCVYPRDIWIEGFASAKNKRYASEYIILDTEHELRESGYDMMPYAVWRWRKNTNELYGRSPASDALTDIKRVNKISETTLRAAQMAADPPFNVPEELQGKVRIRPRGMNYYEESNRLVSPVFTGVNYPVGVDREERIEAILRKHFKVDFFQMIGELESQRTATEIMARQGEQAALLGANLGRLESDGLNPIIDRVFMIEFEAGRIQPPPEGLLRFGRQAIDVDYIGHLSQTQKRLFKTQGTERFLEFAGRLFQMNPEEIVRNLDWRGILKEAAEELGASVKVMRDEEEVNAQLQQEAAMQQEQIQAANMGQMADAVPKLSKAAEEGSPLALLQEAAG